MLNVTDLRAGTTFNLEGQSYVVLKYEHIKMGRGTASIKIKARNILTGAVVEKGFISGARVESIETSKKKFQYLYSDNEGFHFMDPKSFEQVNFPEDVLSAQKPYLKDGMMIDVLFLEDKPLSIELPSKMEFIVEETGPGVKGDTVSNMYKSATLNNELNIKIPLFVEQGEKIIIDTRTGDYVERVK